MTDIRLLPLSFASVRSSLSEGTTPAALVLESYRRAYSVADEGLFTALVAEGDIKSRLETLTAEAKTGRSLPLFGLTFSVKDNIHIAGLPTTANCPALHLMPAETAPVVAILEAAGAVVIGKNTLDQFATGLNGTRGPAPLCRNAINPAYIPGGSSSGSAVAVARGIVSFALGTDTGGSGRVPAACNGIVGIKPTIGLVSSRGLLYNSRLFDCIPVFAQCCADANEILRMIAGFDPLDPFSRRDADAIAIVPALPCSRRLAIPKSGQMTFFGDFAAEAAFRTNLGILNMQGFEFAEIDFSTFEEAGQLVFSSAMVAERLVDYGDVITDHPQAIHPSVLAAITKGKGYAAKDAFEAIYRMKALQRRAQDMIAPFAGLVVPTVPTIFTIDEMLAEPIVRNSIMGTYTYFANPLDLCAISVPGVPIANGLRSALSFIGLPAHDSAIAGLAACFEMVRDSAAAKDQATVRDIRN